MALSQKDIDKFLDENVQDNVKILTDVVAGLKKEKKRLSAQLLGSQENEKKEKEEETWQAVARDTRNAISELQLLQDKCTALQRKLPQTLSGLKPSSDETYAEFIPLLRDLNDMERLRKYLVWVRKIHQLSSRISSRLAVDDMEDAIISFTELSSLVNKLSTSQCLNLKEFVTALCEQQRTLLKEKISHDFIDLLKTINWPVTKDTSAKSLKLWQQKQSLFAAAFKNLLAIDKTQDQHGTQNIPKLTDPLPLPIELLLAPLRKRFKFHFYGDRQTNSKEKPEWFFTQVSTWITDHTHFLEKEIQLILSNSSYHQLNVKVEFMRGLLQEIVDKIHHELTPANHPHNKCILDDDYLMSHLIDELLLFEREIHVIHSYPLLYPSCIIVLQEEGPLCRWLNLEKQFAVEKLKEISESPSAWSALYLELLDNDDTKVPECAERIMQLIAGITERFKQLPNLFLRLQFLELQTDLLLEFHQDLSDNVETVLSVPLAPRFSAYLNAANYIASLLKKWGEETFYLELHYYNQQLNADRYHKSSNEDTMAQIEALRKLDPDFAQLEGTAFDSVAAAFDSLCEDMIGILVEHVGKSLKNSSSVYKKERWHNLHPVQDELSPSAVGFVQKLQEIFHTIKSSITPFLHNTIFEKVSLSIDNILLTQIIYSNHFNEGGASQLYYDVTQVICPLISQHMNMSRETQLLKKTIDTSCLLHELPPRFEHLAKLMRSALNGNEEAYQEATDFLKLMNQSGDCDLTLQEAHRIINLRVFTT